jgi:Tfp pilus assembly protein PilO
MTANLNFEKIKPYLLPIVALSVLVVLVPLVILPWIGDIQTSLATTSTKQTQLTKMQDKVAMLNKMDNQTNKQLLQDKVQPAIPDEADPAGMLGTLEQVAVASGASAKGVHFGGSTAAAPASPSASGTAANPAVATSLSVQGNYASILSFIAQSETVARVVSLTSMHILPVGEDGGILTATFDVEAPYQPIPADLGPADQPLPEQTAAKTKTLDMISKLHQASYAPTPAIRISGKQNPF